MNRVLSKRFVRELREKLFRYIALGLLVAAGMTLVVSLAAAADTIIIGSNNKAEENKLEDGQFSVFVPFTEEQEKMLTDIVNSLSDQNRSTARIIGNVPYKELPPSERKYINTDTETALQVANIIAGDSSMKFSGRISGNSATLTVVGEKNAATVRRIIDNIQNMDLVNELREKGYERIADTNGFVNIRNMQTGETAGFESLREARNMFLDPDNEFFHPTAIRIEENSFFRIVSDEENMDYYISEYDPETNEERAVYLDDEGRCPTFSSVDEALEYAAAHSIDYTNTENQLEHWRADDEERAADRERYENNIIIQTKFPHVDNRYPNDIIYNPDSKAFSWVYFNEEGDGGDGEFIDITVTEDDVLAAYNSENFLEYIYQNCKQNIIVNRIDDVDISIAFKDAPAEKSEIKWTPIPESADDNGNPTSFSTKYKGETFFISENGDGKYDVESENMRHHGQTYYAPINEDFSGFLSRADAEEYFADNIDEYIAVRDEKILDSLVAMTTEPTQEITDTDRLAEHFTEHHEGKFLIDDFFKTGPTNTEFADFIRNAYEKEKQGFGLSGYTTGPDGITFSTRHENGKYYLTDYSWEQVAEAISKAISSGKYITDEDIAIKNVTSREQLLRDEVMRGTGFQDGKFRTEDFYYTNPSKEDFEEFLKNEYGISGHSGYGNVKQASHNANGYVIETYDKTEKFYMVAGS